jgi:hypothetical protein
MIEHDCKQAHAGAGHGAQARQRDRTPSGRSLTNLVVLSFAVEQGWIVVAPDGHSVMFTEAGRRPVA